LKKNNNKKTQERCIRIVAGYSVKTAVKGFDAHVACQFVYRRESIFKNMSLGNFLLHKNLWPCTSVKNHAYLRISFTHLLKLTLAKRKKERKILKDIRRKK